MPQPWGFPLYITTPTTTRSMEKEENQTTKLNLRSHFGITPVVIIMFRNFNKN
jgi:hypothetical protein